MPGLYWIALVGGGLWAAILVLVTVLDAAQGTSFHPRDAILGGTIVYVLVRFYGTARAYQVRIIDDTLEWRAPLRRRHVPLTALAAACVHRKKWYEPWELWRGYFTTKSGETLAVAIHGRSPAHWFVALCKAVQLRVPDFYAPTEPT